MSSSKRAAQDAAWLQHKVAIQRMILQENRSLLETRQKLEEDGFIVTTQAWRPGIRFVTAPGRSKY
ncbi:hypothetical protein ColLi_06582 [Colletotrichum liriopes]|uniref:Clr5 domain-containing protein n=1 Tax=Colletotrichum liriopes TaxID=708192 RepID=A0AA37GMG1_9PEZI|nr:hypothetical protein ColLi_06582 [Colletotrichum liriopes]